MARFKEGQQVVSMRGERWSLGVGPKDGEIVTIEKYHIDKFGYSFCFLIGYTQCPLGDNQRIDFNDKYFEPLMDISELTAILESEPIENKL